MSFGNTQGGTDWVQIFSGMRRCCSGDVKEVTGHSPATLEIQVSHRVHMETYWGREEAFSFYWLLFLNWRPNMLGTSQRDVLTAGRMREKQIWSLTPSLWALCDLGQATRLL